MALNPVPPEPELPAGEEPSGHPPKTHGRSKAVKILRKAQRYSAYGITAFAGLHLTTTVLLPAISVSAANSAFMASRSVYQSQVGEIVLVYGSFGVHILSGLMLRVLRTYDQYAKFRKLNFGKLSLTSKLGYLLTIMATLHFTATRYGPIVKLGDSSLISLDYITYLLQNRKWLTSFSLASLVFVFTAHALGGAKVYFNTMLTKAQEWSIATGVTSLAIASLVALERRDRVSGWIAGQFHLAHSLMDELLGL